MNDRSEWNSLAKSPVCLHWNSMLASFKTDVFLGDIIIAYSFPAGRS